MICGNKITATLDEDQGVILEIEQAMNQGQYETALGQIKILEAKSYPKSDRKVLKVKHQDALTGLQTQRWLDFEQALESRDNDRASGLLAVMRSEGVEHGKAERKRITEAEGRLYESIRMGPRRVVSPRKTVRPALVRDEVIEIQ